MYINNYREFITKRIIENRNLIIRISILIILLYFLFKIYVIKLFQFIILTKILSYTQYFNYSYLS